MHAERNYNKMRTLQWPHHPPPSNMNILPPCYSFPGGTWPLPPARACSYGLISPLSSQKEDTIFTLFFFLMCFFFFNNLSVSPESSSVRHWCPRNCPHQGHRGLPILHSTACLSSSSNRTDGWPVLPFGDVSQTFYCIPCTSVPFH